MFVIPLLNIAGALCPIPLTVPISSNSEASCNLFAAVHPCTLMILPPADDASFLRNRKSCANVHLQRCVPHFRICFSDTCCLLAQINSLEALKQRIRLSKQLYKS